MNIWQDILLPFGTDFFRRRFTIAASVDSNSQLRGTDMKIIYVVISILVIGLVVALTTSAVRVFDRGNENAAVEETVRKLVESEELIQELTPLVAQLSRSILNLKLPDEDTKKLFAETASLTDIDPTAKPQLTGNLTGLSIRYLKWAASKRETKATTKDSLLWNRLLDQIDYFEHAKFYVINAKVRGLTLETSMGFKALARKKDGTWQAIKTQQDVIWSVGAARSQSWQIEKWTQHDIETIEAKHPLFQDVTEQIIPDAAARTAAQRSVHEEELVRKLTQDNFGPAIAPDFQPFFHPDAVSKHPSVSVVDIDQDGLDDLYVMYRWSKNLLFRNRGDGTFEETAASYGLDIDGLCTSASFADFDNDGDPDLFLGRSLAHSMYFENDGNRFVERTNVLNGPVLFTLPALVASSSVVDYNRDGLLDIYLCTYAKTDRDIDDTMAARLVPPDVAKRFLTEFRESSPSDQYLNAAGPPNVLLRNLGNGKFDVAPVSDQLALWVNSLQSTWSDFDMDGDFDVYISNDFAPDHLFRNDGEAGFVDITAESGGEAMMGFGMGASWGDYNNDMRPDLYISNMYSKAGVRITGQIEGLDRRMGLSAEGNRLFQNAKSGFKLMSALDGPLHVVAKADWSWSGQFVDVDNDGFLDIAVASGYYTAPKQIATGKDL